MVETVSIHHRISAELHRRLKIVSVEQRVAVTDIMNEAARQWLERYEAGTGYGASTEEKVSIPSRISSLRASKSDGNFHEEAVGIAKAKLVLIAKHLSVDANARWSRDRLLSAIQHAL
ncbi:hypothetical protein OIU34_23385 [Pararhizobium sp. BT-229]|uniref:hypothetical protein n=1 Tax=Pararhizobium sp. BT-229 TaxID=2986923 RepID=UPI0021F7E091|nr:hypothetical protein [Pararhizobium sp. BT-229]MCV9964840.1 hypothetical protein [Pararhizobium sp. BT-229]